MILSLDVRRAQKGDCLILHFGSKDGPGLILIDGGPANVYGPHLKPRLTQIRGARGLKENDPLPVDLLMVSHIDDDHIHGVLDLTKELVKAKDDQKPLFLKVQSFWHNSFDKIIGNDPQGLREGVEASFGAASLSGEFDTEGLDEITARVLASVDQGMHLQDDARKLGLRNRQFDTGLVTTQEEAVDLDKGLTLTVVGPLKPELAALQDAYDEFLKKKEKKKDKEVVASFTDESVPNLSSIAVLAEAGGKRILLTGDARGDKILEGLEQAGRLEEGEEKTIHVDILKMPHHGSDRNVDTPFFRRIIADHYVFSANGEHGNPDRETLQMLLDVRGEDDDYTIHLTYPLDELDVGREADFNKQQARKSPDKRKKWSPKEQSLTAFFDKHKKFAKKLRFVEEGKPHVIDLLDKLGF